MADTENTIFTDAIIKLKHATTSVANASDKVLEKDEVLLVTPDTGSGTGPYEMRVGDGSTAVKNLPVAINGMKADDINVEEIETIEDENPTLEGGNAIKNLFGRIAKKFSWVETMLGKKVNIADIYDGLDSSNAAKVASANAIRQVNEKVSQNTTDISTLNSNISSYLDIASVQFKAALALNEGKMFTEAITIKNGYIPLTIVDVRVTGNSKVAISGDNSYSNGQISVFLQNNSTSATSVNVTVAVLCCKK